MAPSTEDIWCSWFGWGCPPKPHANTVFKITDGMINPDGSVTFNTCPEAIAFAKVSNAMAFMGSENHNNPLDPNALPYVVICPNSGGGTVFSNPTPTADLGCGLGVQVQTIDMDPTIDDSGNPLPIGDFNDLVHLIIAGNWHGPQPNGCGGGGGLASPGAVMTGSGVPRATLTRPTPAAILLNRAAIQLQRLGSARVGTVAASRHANPCRTPNRFGQSCCIADWDRERAPSVARRGS